MFEKLSRTGSGLVWDHDRPALIMQPGGRERLIVLLYRALHSFIGRSVHIDTKAVLQQTVRVPGPPSTALSRLS